MPSPNVEAAARTLLDMVNGVTPFDQDTAVTAALELSHRDLSADDQAVRHALESFLPQGSGSEKKIVVPSFVVHTVLAWVLQKVLEYIAAKAENALRSEKPRSDPTCGGKPSGTGHAMPGTDDPKSSKE